MSAVDLRDFPIYILSSGVVCDVFDARSSSAKSIFCLCVSSFLLPLSFVAKTFKLDVLGGSKSIAMQPSLGMN